MDMERITLTFQSSERLLEELRGLGRNLHLNRFASLRGRQWLRQLMVTLAEEPLELEFEVIYGHAFKPAPRLAVRSETVLSLEEMKDSLRSAKNRQRGL
jgi:malonyl-CoA O-methyltransferase